MTRWEAEWLRTAADDLETSRDELVRFFGPDDELAADDTSRIIDLGVPVPSPTSSQLELPIETLHSR